MIPQAWDESKAKVELKRRLKNARAYRSKFEPQWEKNEKMLKNKTGENAIPNVRYSFESRMELGLEEVDAGPVSVGVNYAFKNYRFIHSQLSSNPPTVISRPTSSDPRDRTKADAADRLIRHAMRAEKLQEKVDISSAKTLRYGTGWMKTLFDPHQGDIVDMDETSGEFDLSGKINIYSPSTWDVWIDPDAKTWDEVRFVFERIILPLDEAVFLFPKHEDVLTSHADKFSAAIPMFEKNNVDQKLVQIYEYWEKGLPINAFLGRFAICMDDGTVLGKLQSNPFAFVSPGEDEELPTAYLPYHIFTDIDLPDEVYGDTFISYEAPIQDIINRLDNVTLENIEAHGVCRLVLPESAEIAEGSITNSPYDVIKIKGTQGPFQMNPPQLMPETHQLRDRLKGGGDDMAGINEAMMGQMSRETSGFSLQYATNQGNMIRRRLFNKYVLFVESIFKGYLNLVRKHWKESRIIYVLGEEKSFEAIDFKGADINGGFDLIVEYGASLSLDPTTRREELLQLMPLFKEAGVDSKTILSMMKLNELEGLFDIMDLSAQRQKEIFEIMLATNRYISPRELQEHKGMLDYAYRYLMTKEFDLLKEEQKVLIEQHVREREQLMSGGIPGAPLPPGPHPNVAGLPVPGEAQVGLQVPTEAGAGLPAGQ